MTVYLNALFLLLLQLISSSTVAQEAARMAIAQRSQELH